MFTIDAAIFVYIYLIIYFLISPLFIFFHDACLLLLRLRHAERYDALLPLHIDTRR